MIAPANIIDPMLVNICWPNQAANIHFLGTCSGILAINIGAATFLSEIPCCVSTDRHSICTGNLGGNKSANLELSNLFITTMLHKMNL